MYRLPGLRNLFRRTLPAIALVAVLLVACAAPAAPRELAIGAADFSFSVADTVPARWVKINMTNDGLEPHHAQLARLNDGVTLDAFQAAISQDPEKAFPLVTFEGGPAGVGPKGVSEVTLNLREGQYVLLCFLPSPDGVPHIAKGMAKPLKVTAATGDAAREPATKGTIVLNDFAFELPAEIPSGPVALKVDNLGQQPHEFVILRLNDGKTAADVAAFFSGTSSGPPPFEETGGMQGLSGGQSGIVNLNLRPGNYYAVCVIPDPASGKTHLELGMGKEFSVK